MKAIIILAVLALFAVDAHAKKWSRSGELRQEKYEWSGQTLPRTSGLYRPEAINNRLRSGSTKAGGVFSPAIPLRNALPHGLGAGGNPASRLPRRGWYQPRIKHEQRAL